MAARRDRPGGSAGHVVRLDHLVLSVTDVERSALFYETVCGMERRSFDGGRIAMRFGVQKLNLNHRDRRETSPAPLDFCLVTSCRPEEVVSHLRRHGIAGFEGPVERSGALGPMLSVYVRDPDGNIVELASYPPA